MKLFFILSCLFLLAQSCTRSKPEIACILPGLTEMVHMQTQCADVWGYGKTNEESITVLKKYLLQQQIIAETIALQPTGEEAICDACNCSRGFVFHVWVENRYVNSLLKEGFTVR
jgi:hypothetical protein